MLAEEKSGNMREVFLEASKIREIEDRVNLRDQRQGAFTAEIFPDASPAWHVIITQPGHEHIASGHLIGRGFGVYQPREAKEWIRRGRKVTTMRSLFPNYLFVFVWNIEKHMRRIMACPGITGMLFIGNRPAIIPDAEINDIRAEENKRCPMKLMVEVIKKRPRKNKKNKLYVEQIEQRAATEQDIVSVSAFGWINGLYDMPAEERAGALHKALGLPA